MKKFSHMLIAANTILLLLYFIWSVYNKEQVIKNGQLVLLELTPVDPRSLMQGDYMRLNYAISSGKEYKNAPDNGYLVIRLDSQFVAHKVRIQNSTVPLNGEEFLLKYKTSGRTGIKVGPESYFFQEGKESIFEKAKYGGLMTDRKGNSILTGLYDDQFQLLK